MPDLRPSNNKCKQRSLCARSLAEGVASLIRVDGDFARVVSTFGPPPMWGREPGFPTLVRIILEQQVSLASARAAFDNLVTAVRTVAPGTFIKLTDRRLKKIGFSRQKAGYCRGLAEAILKEEFDLNAVSGMDDAAARSTLMRLKGIGPWTADIYLLMALRRPDIWPSGDVALATSLREVKGLSYRPDGEEWERIALPWRPWRAIAARLLWHNYLSTRRKDGRTPDKKKVIKNAEK
jgi:DNA-3-methyladenine glycosylase II